MPRVTATQLNTVARGPAPSMLRDWETINDRGYLESKPFAAFCLKVRKAITTKTSIGDIRRAMGEEFNERWLWDAIDALVGIGSIRRMWGARPLFERCEVHKVQKIKNYNGALFGKGSDPKLVATSMFGERQR